MEFHPFGVKKVKERDTALAGWNYQPDGEYLLARSGHRRTGQ
jgi:hypothetical protein